MEPELRYSVTRRVSPPERLFAIEHFLGGVQADGNRVVRDSGAQWLGENDLSRSGTLGKQQNDDEEGPRREFHNSSRIMIVRCENQRESYRFLWKSQGEARLRKSAEAGRRYGMINLCVVSTGEDLGRYQKTMDDVPRMNCRVNSRKES